jgi:hypothetical protein
MSQRKGVRMVAALPVAVASCGKHLKSTDPLVRTAAGESLHDIVGGVGPVGAAVHTDVAKHVSRAMLDRCPEVCCTATYIIKN